MRYPEEYPVRGLKVHRYGQNHRQTHPAGLTLSQQLFLHDIIGKLGGYLRPLSFDSKARIVLPWRIHNASRIAKLSNEI